MNKYTPHDLTNETIVSTPRPAASSTVDKRLVQRNFGRQLAEFHPSTLQNQINDDSLGILPTKSANSIDISGIEKTLSMDHGINERLLKVRQKVLKSLETSSGIPSRYLKASETKNNTEFNGINTSGSTISESDLLRESIGSVHRTRDTTSMSTRDLSQLVERTNRENRSALPRASMSYSKTIEELANKIRNSDINVKELCNELRMSSSSMDLNFVPAEFCIEKFEEDEKAWQNSRGIPAASTARSSLFSTSSAQDLEGKFSSMSEFFQKRNGDMTDIFSKKSPEKQHAPVPLIDDSSFMSDCPVKDASRPRQSDIKDKSVMSVSQIFKVLSETEANTPNKILQYLYGQGRNKTGADHDAIFPFDDSRTSIHWMPTRNSTVFDGGDGKLTSEFEPPQHSTFTETGEKEAPQEAQKLSIEVTAPEEPALSPTLPSERRRSTNYKSYVSPTNHHQSTRSKSPQNVSSHALGYNSSSPQFPSPTYSSVALENKENIHSNAMSSVNISPKKKSRASDSADADRSLSSVRSGSSLDTLVSGKLPLESTRSELVWGCVKIGKSVTRKFALRNKCHKKIRFQISVSGNCFKIAKSDTEHTSSYTVLLHPLETKAFNVVFSPTSTGPCVEKLSFLPVGSAADQQTHKQLVRLLGYGGQSTVELRNISKDPSGKSWLQLGSVENKSAITKHVTLVNNGSLSAFAHVSFVAKEQYRSLNVEVHPTQIVLHPNSEVNVSIMYNLTKEDIKYMSNTAEMLEIGSLKIMTGEEPTRARIRRLCRKIKQNNCTVDPLMEQINEKFINETPIDISRFSESVSAMKDLSRDINFREIIVTIEQNPDKTLVACIDESSIFQTLYLDNSNLTCLENTMLKKQADTICKVEPATLILTPPVKEVDTILLSSSSAKPVRFEIAVDPPNGLQVTPLQGVVSSKETVLLMISCDKAQSKDFQLFKLYVYAENEVMNVDVKVVFVKKQGFKY